MSSRGGGNRKERSDMNPRPATVHAWLQLIRPPNLFTVPGDPIAGFLLAGVLAGFAPLGQAIYPALAALFIYMGGLIGNDVADCEEDRRDRPRRPIPSGRVSRSAAFAASAALAGLGIGIAIPAGTMAFAMAGLTQLAVMTYNGWLKHHAAAGALGMGACRGFSLLIGVAAAQAGVLVQAPILIAAAGATSYIAGITWIADRETVEQRIGPRRWVPCAAVLIMFLLIAWLTHRLDWPFLALGCSAAGWSGYQGWRLRGIPSRPVLGSSIGGLIRGLLLIQAAFCTLGGTPGLVMAGVLLALWPVSDAVAKRFEAT